MGKTLIIAEKPSVARDLASALGRVKKQGDWFENDEYVISSAVGHLVELFMPEDIDKKLRYWRLEPLPIVPEKFDLKPIDKTKSKFNELKKLMARKDVDQVVNACDAGREGELIFTYVYELAKCKKPVKRLWMQSMTRQAILDAFSHLRDGEQLAPLQDAARCRSEADWLIGINGTRALTTRMYGSRSRGNVATVGRVQTPTLAMVLDRERLIRNFEPRTYWKIVGEFGLTQGNYEGTYQKPDFKKSDDAHDRADRIWEKELAEKIVAEAKAGEKAEVVDEKKRTRQIAPRLYDLTSLQREANGRYGFPARRTLQFAQALYEKHKLITYPRTDSRALPQDYLNTCRDVLGSVEGNLQNYARKALEGDWVKPNKRIFNNAQISDHFAIIPTGQPLKKLSTEEAKIYDMIMRRFIAVFYPSAEYDVTTRTSRIGEHAFKTEGKVLVKPGWLEVYDKSASDNENLTPITDADGTPPQAGVLSLEIKEEQTKPPPRYTEATLLSAMEGAGKLVDDEDLADAMKEKGLGTPATRAQIIEQLINQKYIEREQRELVPTPKADNLVDFLNAVNVDTLTSPALTGEWEYRLHQIENGVITRKQFMEGIVNLTGKIVERTKAFNEEDAGTRETAVISPSDNLPMLETLRTFKSQDDSIVIYKTISQRKLSEEEVGTLIKDRVIGPLDGFRSKAGKPFSAILKLDEENKVRFVFENNGNGNGENGDETLDISTLTVVGKCPKDGANVLETPNAFTCVNGLNGEKSCNFRISRTMLGKTLPAEQIKKLLEAGKTDLIEGFRSKRTKRLFSAYLFLKKNGGIGFEFPPRPAKKKAVAKTDS